MERRAKMRLERRGRFFLRGGRVSLLEPVDRTDSIREAARRRGGLLGWLDLLYMPTAMVIAQGWLAAPAIIGLALPAQQHVNLMLRRQFLAPGASGSR